jgi:hypothetical protein
MGFILRPAVLEAMLLLREGGSFDANTIYLAKPRLQGLFGFHWLFRHGLSHATTAIELDAHWYFAVARRPSGVDTGHYWYSRGDADVDGGRQR